MQLPMGARVYQYLVWTLAGFMVLGHIMATLQTCRIRAVYFYPYRDSFRARLYIQLFQTSILFKSAIQINARQSLNRVLLCCLVVGKHYAPNVSCEGTLSNKQSTVPYSTKSMFVSHFKWFINLQRLPCRRKGYLYYYMKCNKSPLFSSLIL